MAFALTYTTLTEMVPDYCERLNDADFIARLPSLILFAQRRIAREIKILGMQEYVIGAFTAAEGVIAKPNRWLNTVSMSLGAGGGAAYAVTVDNSAQTEPYNFPPLVTDDISATGTGATYQAFVTNGVITQIAVKTGGSGYATSYPLVITPDAENTGAGSTATALANVGNNTRSYLLPRAYEWARFYWPNSLLTGLPKYYADYDFFHWLVVPTPTDDLPIEIAYYQVANLIDETTSTNWLTDNAPDLLLYATMLEASPFLKNPDKTQEWNAMYTSAKQGFMSEDDMRIADRATTRLNNKAAAGGAPQ